MRAHNPNESIVCGKFDNRVSLRSFSSRSKVKVRLLAERLAPAKSAEPVSLSVEDHVVWFNGKFWELEVFIKHVKDAGHRRLVVLTTKEYLYLVEMAAAHDIRVVALETSFPFLPGIKYKSSARANFDALQKCLRRINQLGVREGNFSKDLANGHHRFVVRRLRFKNDYDRLFFFAYKDPYQEVFKLKEERCDRSIIALDFNSMYADSMAGAFCNPAHIEYEDFRGKNVDLDCLNSGVYLVRLMSAKPGFLLDCHPFRYKRLGRSFYFRMCCGDTIETLLQKTEIEYFKSFFERVEVIEGLITPSTIEHPLFTKAVALYEQRKYHAQRGDQIKEGLCKISLQHMHSATNQKCYSFTDFTDLEEVREFLSERFLINTENFSVEQLADFLSRHKYFKLARRSSGYTLTHLDITSRSTVFSLSAQVVANARLKMLRTLQLFLSYPSVELCYANVDSLHISIRRDLAEKFIEQHRGIISDKLGALKIEAIADQGYWFDVGRYWLKKEGKVVLFKNKGFNYKNSTDNFVTRRKVYSLVETPSFVHLRSYIAKVEKSFSYHKRVENIDSANSRFVRYLFEEVKELHVADLTEAKERFRSTQQKVELLQSICEKFD